MKVDAKLLDEISATMKLSLTTDENEDLVKETNRVLQMLASLSEVDTEGIEASYHGRHGEAVFRKDEPVKSPEEVKAMLKQVRAKKGSLIQVPAMLDDGEAGA